MPFKYSTFFVDFRRSDCDKSWRTGFWEKIDYIGDEDAPGLNGSFLFDAFVSITETNNS